MIEDGQADVAGDDARSARERGDERLVAIHVPHAHRPVEAARVVREKVAAERRRLVQQLDAIDRVAVRARRESDCLCSFN